MLKAVFSFGNLSKGDSVSLSGKLDPVFQPLTLVEPTSRNLALVLVFIVNFVAYYTTSLSIIVKFIKIVGKILL